VVKLQEERMSAEAVAKTFERLFKVPKNGVFAIAAVPVDAISNGQCLFAAFHQVEKNQRPGVVDGWTPDTYRCVLLYDLMNRQPQSDLTLAQSNKKHLNLFYQIKMIKQTKSTEE
jgi:hypothetical protein